LLSANAFTRACKWPGCLRAKESGNANASARRCLFRVKTGKAQCEHMFSALPPRADIEQCSRHVRSCQKRSLGRIQHRTFL
jgi:hypothetical protein